MKIMCVGDVVGKSGSEFFISTINNLKSLHKVDFLIVNGENSAKGNGISENSANDLYYAGTDVITGGNHSFRRRDIYDFLDECDFIIRPANYPKGAPGVGYVIKECKGKKIGIINLIGTVFMESMPSPFDCANKLVEKLKNETDIIIVDFHAEASSEKGAIANMLDGKVQAVFGTHTHVQTSDAKILPKGTAFITDIGMTGPIDSILGVDKNIIIKKYLSKMPSHFNEADGKCELDYIILDVDDDSNKVISINAYRKNQD